MLPVRIGAPVFKKRMLPVRLAVALATFKAITPSPVPSTGTEFRDNELCNILFRTAQKANLGPARKFCGLIPGSAARPADIFLRNWERGRDAALDVTFWSLFSADAM